MCFNRNLVDDGNYINASPSMKSDHILSDTYYDLTTHACYTEATTIVVDLSDTETDNCKQNEYQDVGVDVKEATEEPQEIEIGNVFNFRSRLLSKILLTLTCDFRNILN